MALNDTMIGLPIYTEDGSEIGKVKEIRGRYFKVDAPMASDYWLREDCVGSARGGEIRLAVPHDRLDDYKVNESETHETGHTAASSAMVGATAPRAERPRAPVERRRSTWSCAKSTSSRARRPSRPVR